MMFLLLIALAESGCLIESRVVGPVRVGMTAAQARQAWRADRISAAEDSGHIAILAVRRDGQRVLDLYPDSDNPDTQRAQIELIRVYDPN